MKKLLPLAFGLTFACLSSVAFAENQDPSTAPKGESASGRPAHGERFQKADLDHDGRLSLDEFRAAREKRMESQFRKADVNSDGYVSQDEMRQAMKQRRQARHARGKHMRQQRNGDLANP